MLNHEKILGMRNVLFFYVASIISLIKNISDEQSKSLFLQNTCKEI